MYHVYVASLHHGWYYVGVTKDLEKREKQHRSGSGAAWIKRHPLRSMKSVETHQTLAEANVAETAKTKYLMAQNGIYLVRGGAYASVTLTKAEIDLIQREIDHNTNKCFRCGRNNHYMTQCYAKTHVSGHELISDEELTDSDYDPNCERCGRDNHTINECYAKYDIKNSRI